MAKRHLLLILLGLSIAFLGHSGGRPQLTQTYRSFIGLQELTNNNDGPMIDTFLRSAHLGSGYPWCAAFVTYCHRKNALPFPKKAPAWSLSWFPANRLITPIKALPGDVFGIYYPDLKRIAHVGFIDETYDNSGNFILTVEGNTNADGSREGNGVFRKRRSKKQIKHISRWLPD